MDDFVLIDDYQFDETTFLIAELTVLSNILDQRFDRAKSVDMTILQQYSEQVNDLVRQYQQKTQNPKSISWTSLDDRSVIELYSRLLVHQQRLESILKVHWSPMVQNTNQIDLLQTHIEPPMIQNEPLKQQQSSVNSSSILAVTTSIQQDGDSTTTDLGQQQGDDESTSAPSREGELSQSKNAKAMDSDQLKNHYIEQLLSEIDRLTFVSQKNEDQIRQFSIEFERKKADEMYYQCLIQCKEEEIMTLKQRCEQWEHYSNQQDKEVEELNSILVEQIRAKTFHPNNVVTKPPTTGPTQKTATEHDPKDAEVLTIDDILAEGPIDISIDDALAMTPDDEKQEEKIQGEKGNRENESNSTINHTLNDDDDDDITQNHQSIKEHDKNGAEIKQEGKKNQEVQIVEEPSIDVINCAETQLKLENQLKAAKEVVDIAKSLTAKVQSELEIEKELNDDLNKNLEDTQRALALIREEFKRENGERLETITELMEERELRRNYKLKCETAQGQVMKLMTEVAQLVAETDFLQRKLEYCLLNHSATHGD